LLSPSAEGERHGVGAVPGGHGDAVRADDRQWMPLDVRQSPGRVGQILMMVTRRPHGAVRSSGAEVRMVTGPGAARAVALSMASMAYLWPCQARVGQEGGGVAGDRLRDRFDDEAGAGLVQGRA
jgi:hypothetical protein